MSTVDIGVFLLIGAFIGWNLPQPFWAVWIQEKLTELFGKFTAKVKARFAKKE